MILELLKSPTSNTHSPVLSDSWSSLLASPPVGIIQQSGAVQSQYEMCRAAESAASHLVVLLPQMTIEAITTPSQFAYWDDAFDSFGRLDGTLPEAFDAATEIGGNWSTAKARLTEIRELASGWDGYRASPLNADIIARVEQVLAVISRHIAREPAVVPTPDGGVQIEWHSRRADIELHVLPDNTLDVFVTRPNEPDVELLDVKDLSSAAIMIDGVV